jgi:hypothetical protein
MIYLIGINAKYSHTALGVYSISAYLDKMNVLNTILEYTINDPYENIFYDIIEKKPSLIGFSTYIWNITIVKRLIDDIKLAYPNCKIILGGPEAGYSNEIWDNVDKLIAGEGEVALYNYLTQNNIKEEFENLPFPYTKPLEVGKTAYYEASRGCPYRCSYCISSLDKTLRFKDVDRVKKEISYFIENKIKKVKFIDRTFNINENAYEIFSYIISNHSETSFHFEVKPELFSKKDIELLKTAPKGLIQFEAGLQSLNPITLKAINRLNDIEKAFFNLKELIKNDNIRIHLDLIAGLPYEDKKSFIKGFNLVFMLLPHILQLGFLKVLNGTQIKNDAKMHNICYSKHPPYQVISTAYLKIEDIIELKAVENALDTFSNKGFFKKSLEFLFKENNIMPYDFFKLAGENLKNQPPISLPNLFSLFYNLYIENNFNKKELFLENLIFDYKAKNPNKPLFKM